MMPTTTPPPASGPLRGGTGLRVGTGQRVGTGRAVWHRWANAPTLLWLLAAALVAAFHRQVPGSGWLLAHVALLGAATNAIMVYSWHFAEALLRLPVPSRRALAVRLCVLNVGAASAMAGVLVPLWPAAVAGASAVGAAAAWHGAALLVRARRALPSRFASTVRYYLAACALLPFGATAGALLALPDGALPWADAHARLLVAHEAVNVLGWIGLSVLGTLVTLLPTMLRTRADDRAEPVSRRALWVLLAGTVAAAGGALEGNPAVVAVGAAVYLAGVLAGAVPLARAAARKPPLGFAPLSAVAALLWLTAALARLVWLAATSADMAHLHERLGQLTPLLAGGFAVQVLLGALSYLLPVVLGGGPALVRHRTAVLDAGSWFRVVLANGALVLYMLPVPSTVRVAAAAVGLVALSSFVWLAGRALLARAVVADDGGGPPRAAAAAPGASLRSRLGSGAVGLAVLLAAVVGGVAADPAAVPSLGADAAAAGTRAGGPAAGAAAGAGGTGVVPTGHTTTVEVVMAGMRFVPDSVTVPAGDRLVIRLANRDEAAHDLVLASGQSSGRVHPGESAQLDAGVIGQPVEGWCSVVGHRQMGMVFAIHTEGGDGAAHAPPAAPAHGLAAAEPGTAPSAHRAYPAELPPRSDATVHRVTLTVADTVTEVAPGVLQTLWTYNGTAPGPVLRGRVGDRFEITLVNEASTGHSIDFHAGSLAPDGPMRTIERGESLLYSFTATQPGIWMYHCATMPMSLHLANGMVGAVVIEPADAPPPDREYVVVQSEQYHPAAQAAGVQGSAAAPGIADAAKIAAQEPDAVVFNGYPNQYDAAPLTAAVGERVRVWVLNAGVSRPLSFHVVGGQFSAVFSEGAWLLAPGPGGSPAGAAQALALAPAQGGFVDLTFPEPGTYPFVNHYMVDAERGAHGVFAVAAAG